MLTGRIGCVSFVLGGHIYAAGGYDIDDEALNTVERYDAASDRWSSVAATSVRVARRYFGSVVVGGAGGQGRGGEADLFESLITRARARK